MYAFVCCCLLKRMSYNKEIKRETESERRENERNQNRNKKAIMADSAPDPVFYTRCSGLITQFTIVFYTRFILDVFYTICLN